LVSISDRRSVKTRVGALPPAMAQKSARESCFGRSGPISATRLSAISTRNHSFPAPRHECYMEKKVVIDELVTETIPLPEYPTRLRANA
jgi:hypothetical protein